MSKLKTKTQNSKVISSISSGQALSTFSALRVNSAKDFFFCHSRKSGNPDSFSRGFTLLELVIILAIISVLISFSIVAQQGLQLHGKVEAQTQELRQTLRKAQGAALMNKYGLSHGVHLEASRYIYFKGSSFNADDSRNEISTLDSQLQIRNIQLNGGGVDIIFQRLTGKTQNQGSLEVALKDGSFVKKVVVNEEGMVE